MKKQTQMILVLGLVAFFSGSSLVLVYRYAAPLIESNQKKELREAVFEVVPNGVRYEVMTEGNETIYKVYDKRGSLLGYAFVAEGNGYQGKIKLIAALKKDLLTLYGIKVLESIETPGLGGDIVSDDFRSRFKNLRSLPKMECVKRPKSSSNEIQAITGATISSKSVVSILNKKITKIREILKR